MPSTTKPTPEPPIEPRPSARSTRSTTTGTRKTTAAWALALAVGLGSGALVGCSEDDRDEIASQAEDAAREAADRAEDAAGQARQGLQDAGARAQAEAMRAAIAAQDLAPGETVRSISVLQEAADGLVGDPTVEGIADSNGDGFDDDGRVEVRVAQERSCLTLPESGDDIDVGDC